MIHRKTVFVVGAGASHELGFPCGVGFREILRKKLDIRFSAGSRSHTGSDELWNALVRTRDRESLARYRQAAVQISMGLPLGTSIDNFLHTHRDNEKIVWCGKLAIADSIMEAERSCLLRHTSFNDMPAAMQQLAEGWHAQLVRVLVDDLVRELATPAAFNNVAIICFNYDRCIEQFLNNALQLYLLVDEQKAAHLLSGLEIIHPYGVVGDLPWQTSGQGVPFGDEFGSDRLHEVAKGLRTFTESVADPHLGRRIHELIQDADTLAFVGFAYHQQNMDLLFSVDGVSAATRVYGTAQGMSDTDCDAIKIDIRDRLLKTSDVELLAEISPALDCKLFFDEFKRSLTARTSR